MSQVQQGLRILIETSGAGHILKLSAQRVRQLADAGVLTAVRTASGQRLFEITDVERLRDERTQHRAEEASR